MNGFLLDTNCVSELIRRVPDPHVLEWMESADESLLFLSVLTIGEIRKGVTALSPGKRRTQLETWLEVELQSRFAGRILPVDIAIAERWGALAGQAKRAGRALSVVDGLLAATALDRNLTVASRNVDDFAGIPIVNPWDD